MLNALIYGAALFFATDGIELVEVAAIRIVASQQREAERLRQRDRYIEAALENFLAEPYVLPEKRR